MNRWSSPLDEDEVRPAARPSEGAAWVLLFACGAVLLVTSLFWLSQGRFFDSAIYVAISDTPWKTIDQSMPAASRLTSAVVRLYGAMGISASAMMMTLAATSYRRGERWAWYLFWVLPLCSTLDFATLAAYGALSLRNAAWDITLLALSLVGLIMPYQRFFPTPPAPPESHAPGREHHASSSAFTHPW